MEFNLLDAKWIPVLYRNGRFDRLGIIRTLADAGAIRQIAASNPMDNVALLRFLLAMLLWCRPELSEDDRRRLDGAAGVPDEWLSRLREYKAAFNLLGDGVRFYQDASLTEKESRPIADLLVEFPGEDSVNHMRHIVHDGSYGLCPACCALGILRLSVWAPANRYYPASVNPGSAAYAIVQESNLLLTLLANLPNIAAKAEQAPWLTNTPPGSPGAVAYLAWRPRWFWLNVADNGYCAYCGQPATLVKSLCIARGWPTPVTTGQQFGKDVLSEFQKLSGDYKSKSTGRRKLADKVVKIAPVIFRCRMPALLQADSRAAQAPQDESDAAKIARIFDQLYSAGNQEAIKELTKKPTKEEQPLLKREDTQVKKFWVDDPHLLKEAEAIGLPDLNADVGLHASKFWRDALRLRDAKAIALGIVGDGQYIFHDATSIRLPGASARIRANLSSKCANRLQRLLKQVTPNPDRQHPEINAALVLMTPNTEARIRTALNRSDLTTGDTAFLNDIYQPLVRQGVASSVRGSLLRRREALARARSALTAVIKDAMAPPTPSAEGDKPKRPRKKKGGDA